VALARQAPAALISATLTTAGHRAIGTVFPHGGSRQWLFITVDTGTTVPISPLLRAYFGPKPGFE
jgi:hypothetical protein